MLHHHASGWLIVALIGLSVFFTLATNERAIAGEDFPLGEYSLIVEPSVEGVPGVSSYMGVRVQSAAGMPISDLGLMQMTGGDVRYVMNFPAMDVHDRLLLEHAISMALDGSGAPYPDARLALESNLPNFDVQIALDNGEVSLVATGVIQQCALEAFDTFNMPGFNGSVAGEGPCPNDNCTEYLRDWLEDVVRYFRDRGLTRMADLLQELLDKERIVVDVAGEYTPLDRCEVWYKNPFIGKKYIYISPACLEEGGWSKGQLAGAVMALTMLGIDKELRKWDLTDPADKMAFELLMLTILVDGSGGELEKNTKIIEMLRKMMEAVGLRPMATMFECIQLARMYHISEDAKLLAKLRKCVRKMIAEAAAIIGLGQNAIEQLIEKIKKKMQRLTELMEAKDWETIEEEFGITRECFDPIIPGSMACPESPAISPRCGSVDAGSCFEAHETASCSDRLTCAQVCEQDPFCCTQAWDQWCVDAAEVLAGEVCAQGDCCDPGPEPGCNDPLCCQMVCDVMPFCCSDAWDELCVKAAGMMCPQACDTTTAGCAGSLNDCLQFGEGPGCADANCCVAVCLIDPMCCDVQWDLSCAAQASVVCDIPAACGSDPAADCCSAHGSASCADPACCGAVCEFDPYCCDTVWDELCVMSAQEICGCVVPLTCGVPGAGPCFEAHGGVGCDDASCCDSVCAIDPFCCSLVWDAICVSEAEEFCGVCPQDCVSGDTFLPPPDGAVDGADLAVLLTSWGRCKACCADTVNSEFQPIPDGVVNGADLGVLLTAWGEPGCQN